MAVGSLLRLVRILVAIVVLAVFVGLFADFGMTIPSVAAWLVHVQFLPAAMSFAIATFVIWLIVTLVFGRIYCSTVCPLGVFQDICARLPRLGRRVRPRWYYHYSAPFTRLRAIMLFLVALSIVLGISALSSLLDPYSIFGRFGLYVIKPLWASILNLWGTTPQLRFGVASLAGMLVSVLTMVIIGAIAFRNGRTFCNTVCPVGTTLSFISRYSIFRIDINTDRCIQCRRCEHRCKASCIDLTSHVVDTSRCVVCFDCLTDCPNDAISYTYNRHQLSIPLMQRVKGPVAGSAAGMGSGHLDATHTKNSSSASASADRKPLDRRRFLMAGAVVAAAPAVAQVAGAVDKLDKMQSSPRHRGLLPVTPPGIRSRREFLDRCTACGLCVDRCPQKVIKVALKEYGLLRALHPVMDYDESWCIYNCTLCTNLCPTGALHPLTVAEKLRSSTGQAYTDKSYCISYTQGVKCGACSRRCPTGAITMTAPDSDGKGPYPVVDPKKCIGCGACQYVCPSKPKAIKVGGLA